MICVRGWRGWRVSPRADGETLSPTRAQAALHERLMHALRPGLPPGLQHPARCHETPCPRLCILQSRRATAMQHIRVLNLRHERQAGMHARCVVVNARANPVVRATFVRATFVRTSESLPQCGQADFIHARKPGSGLCSRSAHAITPHHGFAMAAGQAWAAKNFGAPTRADNVAQPANVA